MTLTERLYRLAAPAIVAATPLAARGEGKVARAIRARRGAVERLRAWGAAQAGDARPLLWFHAPSVGEGLQARAVIRELRARRGDDIRILYTYFSPSAASFAPSVPADHSDFLPFDTPAAARITLTALRPAALVFSKNEVWPNLTAEAAACGIPMALLSATLPEGSGRLTLPGRALMGPAYRRMSRIAAISEGDARRHQRFGVPPERIGVMGDARMDQVWERARGVDPDGPLLAPLRDEAPTLVAGSTWPADEERLLPAFAAASAGGDSRLVLVPHEPTQDHLRAAEHRCTAAGLPVTRLAEVDAVGRWDTPVLLVDRVGVLGDLYALADMAYVGGGFGRAGLHSVLEPAAFGAPVLFGPHRRNAREAGELIHAGGAVEVGGADALTKALSSMLQNRENRRRAGAAARAYVEGGLGAARRGADLVEQLLETGIMPG
jgi:3-deoxy-D-manno-octulosonic-acid transferase